MCVIVAGLGKNGTTADGNRPCSELPIRRTWFGRMREVRCGEGHVSGKRVEPAGYCRDERDAFAIWAESVERSADGMRNSRPGRLLNEPVGPEIYGGGHVMTGVESSNLEEAGHSWPSAGRTIRQAEFEKTQWHGVFRHAAERACPFRPEYVAKARTMAQSIPPVQMGGQMRGQMRGRPGRWGFCRGRFLRSRCWPARFPPRRFARPRGLCGRRTRPRSVCRRSTGSGRGAA